MKTKYPFSFSNRRWFKRFPFVGILSCCILFAVSQEPPSPVLRLLSHDQTTLTFQASNLPVGGTYRVQGASKMVPADWTEIRGPSEVPANGIDTFSVPMAGELRLFRVPAVRPGSGGCSDASPGQWFDPPVSRTISHPEFESRGWLVAMRSGPSEDCDDGIIWAPDNMAVSELGRYAAPDQSWSLLRFSHNGTTLERWAETKFLEGGDGVGGCSGASPGPRFDPPVSRTISHPEFESRGWTVAMRTGPSMDCDANIIWASDNMAVSELGTFAGPDQSWSLLRFSHNGTTLERWAETKFLEGGGSPIDGPPALPPIPGLNDPNRVTLPFSASAMTVAGYPANTCFYLPNGNYNNLIGVNPKDGMKFIGQSRGGVKINGGRQGISFIRSHARDVTIARMTISGFGGNQEQNRACIEGKTIDWGGDSSRRGKDWTLFELDMTDNNSNAVILGHRFNVLNCSFQGHSPTAVAASESTGGLVQGCVFRANGRTGAPGAFVNNAQVKIVWHNIGPWGDPSRDYSIFNNGEQRELPETMKFYDNTFDCEIAGEDNVRALWFDLDVRDTEVAWNRFTGSNGFAVFYEGCNGGYVHHNTFTRCGRVWQTNGQHSSAYYAPAALVTGSSDNIRAEYNVFQDCPASMIVFLGERGRNGADWVTAYPVATAAWNYRIRNTFAPIAADERSTVGASHHSFKFNELKGTSQGVGYVFGPGINVATEANANTMLFESNSYDAHARSGRHFFWNRSALSYDEWRSQVE